MSGTNKKNKKSWTREIYPKSVFRLKLLITLNLLWDSKYRAVLGETTSMNKICFHYCKKWKAYLK